jgi:hypothetical protein
VSDGKEIQLDEEDRQNLRLLVTQGLHGGAPEYVRDQTITSVMELLSVGLSDNAGVLLSPFWTKGTVQEARSNKGTIDDVNKNNFILLLCSVMSGECFLIFDELTAILHERSQTILPSESATDEADPIARRYERCVLILRKVLSFYDVIHDFILEKNSSDPSEGHYYSGCWSDVTLDVLLQIRNHMQRNVHIIFEYIAASSKVMTERCHCAEAQRLNCLCDIHSTFAGIAGDALRALRQWIVDDDKFMVVFTEKLADVIGSSCIGAITLRCASGYHSDVSAATSVDVAIRLIAPHILKNEDILLTMLPILYQVMDTVDGEDAEAITMKDRILGTPNLMNALMMLLITVSTILMTTTTLSDENVSSLLEITTLSVNTIIIVLVWCEVHSATSSFAILAKVESRFEALQALLNTKLSAPLLMRTIESTHELSSMLEKGHAMLSSQSSTSSQLAQSLESLNDLLSCVR